MLLDISKYPNVALVLASEKAEAVDPSLRPPKRWFDFMAKKIKDNNPSYSKDQIQQTIGHIWYHQLTEAKRKSLRAQEGKHYGPAKSSW